MWLLFAGLDQAFKVGQQSNMLHPCFSLKIQQQRLAFGMPPGVSARLLLSASGQRELTSSGATTSDAGGKPPVREPQFKTPLESNPQRELEIFMQNAWEP